MPKQNIRTKKYHCKFCGEPFNILPVCVAHEEKHNYIYIPMTKEMINRLLTYIYTKDEGLLGDKLGQLTIATLRQYLRAEGTKDNIEDD